MGYHIFMARKCQLTTLKNNAYADMMNQWVAQEHVADQKLDAMETNSENLSAEYKNYSDTKDSIYEKYDVKTSGHTLDETDASGDTYRAKRDAELDKAKSDYEEAVNNLKSKYSINIQELSDEESSIEKKIQILETHISEYTQEMAKAEQQEATEIKTCIPNYNGAGGGQG